MQAAATFEASKRNATGKGEARALRRDGQVPVIIYGEGEGNISLSLSENKLTREYKLGGFFSKILEIKEGSSSIFALPKEVQRHPVSERIEHVDFLRVTEKSTIKVLVPVHFLNQDRCIGIKRGGNLNIVRHDLELVCNVANIPRHIEVDVKDTNIGDSIHISSVSLPEGVRPAITDRDFTIATVAGRGGKQDAEETTSDAPSAADVPATSEKKDKAE